LKHLDRKKKKRRDSGFKGLGEKKKKGEKKRGGRKWGHLGRFPRVLESRQPRQERKKKGKEGKTR